MLPPLPVFNIRSSGARFGSVLNQIRRRIYRQTLISSATIKVTDTDRGQQLDRVGGVGASSALSLGFTVAHTGASVTVAPGKVLSQYWSGTSAADFKPADCTLENNYAGTTLSASATEVWLNVTFTETDLASEGLLGTTEIDMSGGAGGHGGGGGGGGASVGIQDDTTAELPSEGADGIDGGAGGAGGIVRDDGTGLPLSTTTPGTGGTGGAGGAGGVGQAGTAVTFTRATKAVVQVRYFTLSGIAAYTSKGSASSTSTWVKLATISGTNVVQHHIGTLRLHPATITFVAP
jgi:hypothetical protein